MPLFTPLLTLLACLDNRGLEIADLTGRVMALEATTTAQAATIAGQAALIEAQTQAIASLEAALNDSSAGIGTRVAALETTVGELGGTVDEMGATVEEIVATVDEHAANINGLVDGLTILDGRIDNLETSADTMAATLATVVSEAATLGTRLSAAEANVADLEADVADLQADAGGGGGVWSDEGSGSGNCARANVTTTSAGPLYVFATVDATYSFAGGCSSGGYLGAPFLCRASSYTAIPTSSGSLHGDIDLVAESSDGSWTSTTSTTVDRSTSFTPASDSYTYVAYSSYLSLSDSWTVPLQAVLDIPAAGSYIVDLDVTGISGSCTLVVLQP